jgi:predicted ester cyclase
MTPPEAARVVRELHDIVWSAGDLSAVDRLVAEPYLIHSDPGDPWEGQALDRATYRERVMYSRTGFPDLRFILHDVIPTAQRVAVRWSAEGTHTGDLAGLPATGKRLWFAGQTIYDIVGDQVAGHWQVVDRLGFMQRLRGVGG